MIKYFVSFFVLASFGFTQSSHAKPVCKDLGCPQFHMAESVVAETGYVCMTAAGEYFEVNDPRCAGLDGSVSVQIPRGVTPHDVAKSFYARGEFPEPAPCTEEACITAEGYEGNCLETSYLWNGTSESDNYNAVPIIWKVRLSASRVCTCVRTF